MEKWADYLISQVTYTSDHLISNAIRHKDTDQGITKGQSVDRLTIASDIKNGLLYITIYNQNNSWKKGHRIQTFSIRGTPYLRIDQNKVQLDFLGDLPEPAESEEEATPEQLFQLNNIQQQINELESILSSKLNPSFDDSTSEQFPEIEKLGKEIKQLENDNIEHIIIQTLHKQNEKLDDIERKLHSLETTNVE
jgi:hypothetical protein